MVEIASNPNYLKDSSSSRPSSSALREVGFNDIPVAKLDLNVPLTIPGSFTTLDYEHENRFFFLCVLSKTLRFDFHLRFLLNIRAKFSWDVKNVNRNAKNNQQLINAVCFSCFRCLMHLPSRFGYVLYQQTGRLNESLLGPLLNEELTICCETQMKELCQEQCYAFIFTWIYGLHLRTF